MVDLADGHILDTAATFIPSNFEQLQCLKIEKQSLGSSVANREKQGLLEYNLSDLPKTSIFKGMNVT